MNNFSDFHTVKDLKFDVNKLQESLYQVLKIKDYDNANGIKNFAAICLNQIPGKPESTQGIMPEESTGQNLIIPAKNLSEIRY